MSRIIRANAPKCQALPQWPGVRVEAETYRRRVYGAKDGVRGDKSLSPLCRAMGGYMMELSTARKSLELGYAYVSTAHLADKFGACHRAAEYATASLRKAGWFKVTRAGRGQGHANQHWPSQPDRALPLFYDPVDAVAAPAAKIAPAPMANPAAAAAVTPPAPPLTKPAASEAAPVPFSRLPQGAELSSSQIVPRRDAELSRELLSYHLAEDHPAWPGLSAWEEMDDAERAEAARIEIAAGLTIGDLDDVATLRNLLKRIIDEERRTLLFERSPVGFWYPIEMLPAETIARICGELIPPWLT